jgi:2-succinyl-5-enolpyruvyl-6-hydroxy-3-cyclohexene-1-carboxylate synthase
MTTNKPIVNVIAELASAKGMQHAVISSGSRNAPIVMAFDSQKKIRCLSVIDERSAGFFALGIAQQTGKPVALICTSGSAVLNYAPAIVEAFYQKIPLLILTADRPTEWIDQDDGQTIRQQNIFSSYIKASFTLPADANHPDELWYAEKAFSEAFNIAAEQNNQGPVHVNIPLREPLYGESTPIQSKFKNIEVAKVIAKLDDEAGILKEWGSAKKKMVICGLHKPDKKLNALLSKLATDDSVIIMTESTSNLFDEKFVSTIDGYFESLSDAEKKELQPEILVTLGGPVTTKKFKAYLRKYKPQQHWHISSASSHIDTYQSLTRVLPVSELEVFSMLIKAKNPKSDYSKRIKQIEAKALKGLDKYLSQIPFSDLKVFQSIFKHLPPDSDVQVGNSTPIRYTNLFDLDKTKASFYSNRGVSGIDGSVSTAAGAALGSGKMTTLITGDLAFFYDSNGLWNKHLPENLRIIVINNNGGGIFRIIDSKDSPLLEEYFEATHSMKAEPFAKAYNVPYYVASNEKELENTLVQFYKPHKGKPVILEIFTPNKINAEVLLGYFKFLKK